MTRVELLRDLYVWAYERSTQEYLAIKQDLAEPDPLRLAWRNLIKQTIREVITHAEIDPLCQIQQAVMQHVPEPERRLSPDAHTMRTGGFPMKNIATQTTAKRPFNLTLNETTVEQARQYTNNLSATVDGLLAEFVARETHARDEQRALHEQISAAWNRVEDRHGAYGDEYSPL